MILFLEKFCSSHSNKYANIHEKNAEKRNDASEHKSGPVDVVVDVGRVESEGSKYERNSFSCLVLIILVLYDHKLSLKKLWNIDKYGN